MDAYKAFISYSHFDTAWAEWLHRRLESYRVPSSYIGLPNDAGEGIPARLTKVFRDRDELTSGHHLAAAIREALSASEHLIVVCSPLAARSAYVNEEVLEFKRLGRATRIHPLIVAGEPYASRRGRPNSQECLPPALLFTIDVHGA